jgi:hypothetical protein
MQEQGQFNIQLDKTLPIMCDECGEQTFMEVTYLRKVSKFLTGSTKDSLLPIPTFACVGCGHVNEEFIPEPLKQIPDAE